MGALQIVEHMQCNGIKRDTITFSALISACDKTRDFTKALQVYGHMQRQGIKPNIVTYSGLISICNKAQDLSKALQLLEHMQRHHQAQCLHLLSLNQRLRQVLGLNQSSAAVRAHATPMQQS